MAVFILRLMATTLILPDAHIVVLRRPIQVGFHPATSLLGSGLLIVRKRVGAVIGGWTATMEATICSPRQPKDSNIIDIDGSCQPALGDTVESISIL